MAFKTSEIADSDILKHDTSFAVCLLLVANGTLFVRKKLECRVRISEFSKVSVRVKSVVAAAYWLLVIRM